MYRPFFRRNIIIQQLAIIPISYFFNQINWYHLWHHLIQVSQGVDQSGKNKGEKIILKSQSYFPMDFNVKTVER